MFLAFRLSDIITIPFGYLLDWLYIFTRNYGVALILFAILVQVVLLPITAKSKKSMMKMSRLTPRIQDIQRRYAGDQMKQSQAMQDLYREEGVSMGGGCLWSFIPILILIPLYAVVRQPIVYMLHQSTDVAQQIISIIKEAEPALFSGNIYYDEMIAASHIPEFAEAIRVAIPTISERVLEGINFSFFGINLGLVPQFNVFGAAWVWNWANIGAFLIPLLSAGSQVATMFIMQKMNDSVITNEKGIQDKEVAQNSQAAQTNKVMMWMMPIMSLWIGFTVPCALSLYWLISGVARTVEDTILTKRYRKIYDAEDAIRLQKAMEQDRIEAEKERIRAERRAANPDGIVSNTSKKKLQKQQHMAEEAAKAAAAKEYAAKKGIVEEKAEEKPCMSGIPDRPYCKGRAYDPNRYKTTEE